MSSGQSLECGDWTEWSECPVSCGGPSQETRSRLCQLVDTVGAIIEDNIVREETRICGMEECPLETTTTTTTTTTTPMRKYTLVCICFVLMKTS